MGLFLANKTVASAWYHNMISGPAGQTKYGSIEGLAVDGRTIAPVLTWDSKITTVISMLGGFSDIVSRKMHKDGVY
jgi:hypothetical protein